MNYQYSKANQAYLYEFDLWERNIIRKHLRREISALQKKKSEEAPALISRLEEMVNGLGMEYKK